jgi:hypothetical protein
LIPIIDEPNRELKLIQVPALMPNKAGLVKVPTIQFQTQIKVEKITVILLVLVITTQTTKSFKRKWELLSFPTSSKINTTQAISVREATADRILRQVIIYLTKNPQRNMRQFAILIIFPNKDREFSSLDRDSTRLLKILEVILKRWLLVESQSLLR